MANTAHIRLSFSLPFSICTTCVRAFLLSRDSNKNANRKNRNNNNTKKKKKLFRTFKLVTFYYLNQKLDVLLAYYQVKQVTLVTAFLLHIANEKVTAMNFTCPDV